MTAFFVTGGTGFIGQRVLAALERARCEDVTVLTRPHARTVVPAAKNPTWTNAVGRLEDPDTYGARISRGAVVIHLAGLTGNHSPSAFASVNVRGTGALLQAAEGAGCSHFVFVSSIAAVYRDQRFYPYAASKRAAEVLVTGGGTPFTILRPTIVLGPGSAGQEALTRLALLPRPILFGDGKVLTQPIHVDDVARMTVLAATEQWAGESVDAGGPEVVPLAALFERIRAAHGAPARSPLRVPLAPLRTALAMVEPFIRPLLPFTAGQLALFANDSIAAAGPRLAACMSEMRPLDEMLEETRRAA